jgi:vacuolar-type H+-ATPase subunit I/STV1
MQDNVSAIEVFRFFVAREKALYQAMNNMKLSLSSYIGYYWSPVVDEAKILHTIQAFPATKAVRYNMHSITPPTYIHTNEFTYVFQ